MSIIVLRGEPDSVIRVKCDRCRTVSNFHTSNTHYAVNVAIEEIVWD